ncbi:ADP-ribosylglycohydrolase [Rhizocola hellebori]|uniref:ADP-ribosylglycohydrolase n=2 Tax=Rhizocola hellebori TaxID=1392758 RepID=A0A8J3QHY3_9ACTN|nr:ADP-ribosylglycohydrolase [Rhizocola hellebori]
MLGLVVGDAVGTAGGALSVDGPLIGTSAGQLVCFTVEGVIRAHVRISHRGICHPPSVVWHAYHRWAVMQGIPGIKEWHAFADVPWPDGWLAQVSALAIRRGSAPATVSALQSGRLGTVEEPSGASIGAHALTRTLPTGLIKWWLSEPEKLAMEIAALTHAPAAAGVAALGATIVANLANGHEVGEAVRSSLRDCQTLLNHDANSVLASALAASNERSPDASALAGLAPKATALASLAGATYVAASFPEPGQIRDALLFAASVPHGKHIAAAAGALLGSAHGVDALPTDWISRLELGWVADTLARDMISEFADSPSGGEYTLASDSNWMSRYPGW